jgi:hypothetical protein
VARPCEDGNEPSCSIDGGRFLDELSDCQLLNKDSVSWSWLVGFFNNDLYKSQRSSLRIIPILIGHLLFPY